MSKDINPTLLIASVVLVTIFLVYISDRWHRRHVRRSFQRFSAALDSTQSRENRSVPRVSVPDSLDVLFKIEDEHWLGRNGRVVDFSLSGLAVEPNFPLKRLPQDIELCDLVVETPVNRFVLEKVRAVRIEHQLGKRLLAFQILSVAEEQYAEMKRFIGYLDAFSQI